MRNSLEVVELTAEKRADHRDQLLHDPVVLLQHEAQAVVVGLELVLLQQHHLGAVRHLHADALQALSLADQLHDLAIEVHVQLVVLRVANDERRVQPSLGGIN